MKRNILLLTSFLLFAFESFGSPISSNTAEATVKGWLRLDHTPLGEPLGNQVKKVETFRDSSSNVLYHVVYLEPSGFVIVSGDDLVEPIIAFASQGRFDPSLNNPLGALVSGDVPKRVAYARTLRATAITGHYLEARNKWQTLEQTPHGGPSPAASPSGLSSVSDIRVAPFTQTLWNQSTANNGLACYNYFTPPYAAGASANYVCGCVATATAQLLRYFQYPTAGVGTALFTDYIDGVATNLNLRGGDGAGGPYDWGDMPLNPSNPTDLQCKAIGALVFDCSVAVNMDYFEGGVDTSAASDYAPKTALIGTFMYSNAVYGSQWNGTGLVGTNLLAMINPNLDARLPVMLDIEPSGGHEVLCDGYGYDSGTLYHHLNMGWGGEDNVWYALPNIEPSNTGYIFTNITACVYNVYTNGSGEIISGRVVAGNNVPLPNATVTAMRAGGGTYSTITDANGIYALAKVPSASQYTLTVTETNFISTSANFSTGKSSDFGTNSGNVWGANFSITPVVGPPLVMLGPSSGTINLGSTTTFNIAAVSQQPLSYQWQFLANGSSSWTDLNDGTVYSGSQSATLDVNALNANTSGGQFRCIVINPSGSVTSSPPAVLSVNEPLLVTTLAGLAGTNGSVNGTGTNALFRTPWGIAVDSVGGIYVADFGNNLIRIITSAGVVSNFANYYFYGPEGIAVDSGRNVYVADTFDQEIRKITSSGIVSTIAGLIYSSGSVDGTNANARFNYPGGIAVDSATNIYVADTRNNMIRKIARDKSGTNWVVSTIAGTINSGSLDGVSTNAQFNNPDAIAVDGSTNIYVADTYNQRIRKISLDSTGTNWVVTTIAGGIYQGSADGVGTYAQFIFPFSISLDKVGNLYIADYNAIRKMTTDATGTNWVVTTLAGSAYNSGIVDGIGTNAQFNSPYGIAVDSATNIYVADTENNTIRVGRFASVVIPTLQITHANNQATLSWPIPMGIFTLESTTNLAMTNWIPVTPTSLIINGQNVVTNSTAAKSMFFRLKKQ